MVVLSCSYDAPSGKAGHCFVGALVEDLHGVQDRQWNSERFINFQTVILQRARHVAASHAIQRRIEKRIDALVAGRHRMLLEETLCTCAQYLTAARREESDEHRAKTYHSLVL